MEPDITKSQVFTALRSFLLLVVPSAEVIQGQDNRVPMPKDNFIAMVPHSQERLATNITEYVMNVEQPDDKNLLQKIKYGIQVDCYSPLSSDWATAISTAFRDSFAVEQFEEFQPGVTPLYCDDPKQVPFINAEMQYEKRWMVMVYVQYDPTVTVPAQLATELSVPTMYPVL